MLLQWYLQCYSFYLIFCPPVGIVVSDWTYTTKHHSDQTQTGLRNITFMTWDFGGQVHYTIYYAYMYMYPSYIMYIILYYIVLCSCHLVLTGGVLCYSSVFLVKKVALSCSVECHSWKRRSVGIKTMATQHTGYLIYYMLLCYIIVVGSGS